MNILILTGRFGMGHYSAASTLALQLQKQYPNAAVTVQDLFQYITPKHYQRFYQGYTDLVSHVSGFYNWYYQMGERRKKNQKPPMMLFLFRILERMMEETRPDVIFSTLPICSQLVSWYKEIHYLPIPLVTCITDITTHNEWVNDNTSYYLVGSQILKEQLAEKGVQKERIFASGIPVKEEFKKEYPNYGTPKRQLLIMGGGLGLIPWGNDFYHSLNALPDVHTTIILGNNRKLYEKLHGVYENIQVIGYTNQVADYMHKADVLLSKPGGITMFETIYSKLPMMVLSPFLQQEIKNAKFIESQGLGKVIWNKNEDFVQQIHQFLQNDEELSQIRKRMVEFRLGLEENALAEIMQRVMNGEERFLIPGTAGLMRKGVVLP